MNVCEQLCLTKLIFVAMEMMSKDTISSNEMETASGTLKHMANQRHDWTDKQRDLYKLLVDCAKRSFKAVKDNEIVDWNQVKVIIYEQLEAQI